MEGQPQSLMNSLRRWVQPKLRDVAIFESRKAVDIRYILWHQEVVNDMVALNCLLVQALKNGIHLIALNCI